MNYEPTIDAALRTHLHDVLDEIIAKMSIWRALKIAESTVEGDDQAPSGKDAQSLELANQIWQESLVLAGQLTSGSRQQLAPTFDPSNRIGMRHALSELIVLLGPIMPAKPSGLSPVSEKCHSTDDLLTYLSMLDYGEAPPIFTREVGNRSYVAWQRDRYKFLQALWSIYFHARQVLKSDAKVVSYFSDFGKDVQTLARWRGKLETAGAEGSGIWGLTAAQVREALTIANSAAFDVRSEGDSLTAATFWSLAFGRRHGTITSIEEAGKQYREFQADVDARQPRARRRGARSKKAAQQNF